MPSVGAGGALVNGVSTVAKEAGEEVVGGYAIERTAVITKVETFACGDDAHSAIVIGRTVGERALVADVESVAIIALGYALDEAGGVLVVLSIHHCPWLGDEAVVLIVPAGDVGQGAPVADMDAGVTALRGGAVVQAAAHAEIKTGAAANTHGTACDTAMVIGHDAAAHHLGDGAIDDSPG